MAILKLKKEIVVRENACLASEIALLEGRHRSDRPKLESSGKSEEDNISTMIQQLLDGQDAIEEHNRKHPEAPHDDVADALRLLCGDCASERAARNSQLKEEASKR